MKELIQLLKTDANAANAFAAFASAMVASLAFAVSIISVFVSVRALKIQRRHNVLSVSPMPEVTVSDYENSLRVKVRNNGSGPLIIKSLDVSNGSESRPSIIEWMPSLPGNRHWTNFSNRLENRSLLPGGEIILVELTEYDGETNYAQCRDLCRLELCALKVTVTFTDVYETVNLPYVKSLDWFGRHNNDA
jgi:hypothetical protein